MTKLQAAKERDEIARRNQAANTEAVKNENNQIAEQLRLRQKSPTAEDLSNE